MTTIKQGSQGDDVKSLQRRLGLTPDGFFGANTYAAVLAFQTEYGLVPDGIVGPSTWTALNIPKTWLRDSAILQAVELGFGPGITSTSNTAVINSINNYGHLAHAIAPILGVEEAVVHAVIAVESAGSGMENKRIKIRFETHIFWRRWGKYHQTEFKCLYGFDKKEPWKNQTYLGKSFHGNQDQEYKAFHHAKELNAEAAHESISVGAGQLMGFHWQRLGFSNVHEFINNQINSERNQIIALFDFIKSDNKMLTALKQRNWYDFAYSYNGSGQPEKYSQWLKQRYDIANLILDTLP